MHKALDQSLTKKNVKMGFRVTKIWPFNLKAMDEKTKSINIYTTMNSNMKKVRIITHQRMKLVIINKKRRNI